MTQPANPQSSFEDLLNKIQHWAQELGFQQVGISHTQLETAGAQLQAWLHHNYHGSMDYMAKHGSKRYRPAELIPGTLSIISVRMDYLPAEAADAATVMQNPELGFVSRYALGRDYHKVLRSRLQRLAHQIEAEVGPFGYRVFTDSAPVLEKAIAVNAGLGWQGKHTNVLNRTAGSWFFLGEIYTDLPLPPNEHPEDNHCGRCRACLDVCPTQAIIAPYVLDARRCISYLTIENPGPIPLPLRALIGNRIYGCDDCQLVCPWNRFAHTSQLTDFSPREALDAPRLVDLMQWSEQTFRQRLEGSPIRRIGHVAWLRNIAVALGNGVASQAAIEVLQSRLQHENTMLREHIQWALEQLHQRIR